MMGADGLRRATQVAILSANYVARRLDPHFPVLYTGRGGLVAHECILDLRPITAETGITAEDVAKRLIDYGFHAPTMSFPVAGTLMVEPTESEDLAELDRFCDAMIAIPREIAQVASGDYDAEDNPLKNAPHTATMLLAADWKHPYRRERGRLPGCRGPAGRSTGRRSGGSTRPTATGTWSAPARRRRRSLTDDGAAGPMAARIIRVARRPDARAAAAMLARAFDDDPVMMWIIPDEQLRRHRLPALFAVLLRRYYLPHQATELVLTADGVLGCGMWAPPGRWLPPARRQLAAVPGIAGALGSRFLAANSAFGAIARLHPREPHWYLAGLGTDPPAQRTGVGGRLLRSRLARCDMTGHAGLPRVEQGEQRRLLRDLRVRRDPRDQDPGRSRALADVAATTPRPGGMMQVIKDARQAIPGPARAPGITGASTCGWLISVSGPTRSRPAARMTRCRTPRTRSTW